MTARTSHLKPCGYDVVMRNRDSIQRINRRIKTAARPSVRGRLIDEKERLMEEMWAACPHQSVAHSGAVRTTQGLRRMRFCTSCGFDESSTSSSFHILKACRGRILIRLEPAAFSVRLGKTLRWTGINI